MVGDEVLAPLPRPSLSDDVTRRVLALIRDEDLGPGDRLPSVRSLAERFSVAPPTVREALRRLQANGVVELRHGSGVYVRNVREKIVLSNPDYGGLDAGTILELLEARLLIEPHLAGLAAGKVGDAELGVIERLLDEAERYLDGDHDRDLQRVNMEFHRVIAGASGNGLLSQIVELLVELYSAEQLAIQMIYGDRVRDHRQHREILAAIRSKDPRKSSDAMRRHIRGVKNVIEEKLAGDELENIKSGERDDER